MSAPPPPCPRRAFAAWTWRLPVISSYRLIRLGNADRLTKAALLGLLLEDITTARYDPM